MQSPRDTDVGELLRQLSGAGVEFIVVGGAAAVLHGAPITTEDLDIVHRRSPENVARLKTLLDRLDAYVRELANRRLPPQESTLLGNLDRAQNENRASQGSPDAARAHRPGRTT